MAELASSRNDLHNCFDPEREESSEQAGAVIFRNKLTKFAMDATTEKGLSIFLDVFRRADKNDDGALSWEEFKSYFADGVLSEQELQKLFHDIDTHNSNNLDTGELCTYFAQHLGPFKAIFSALEDLNAAVSEALLKSSQDYSSTSHVGQFTTRFILRESLRQLAAIERPVEVASDTLDEQAREERRGQAAAAASEPSPPSPRILDAEELASVVPGSILPGRYQRRVRRQVSSQSSWTEGGGTALNQQVDRLKELVDKLEHKVNFDHMTDEDFVDSNDEKLMFVVSRRLRVNEGQEKGFRGPIRTYVEAANQAEGCTHVNIRSYVGTNCFVIYEIWTDEQAWKKFVSSDAGKAFRRSCVDYLEIPEQLSTLKLPGQWWERD